jgi:thiol-disulfide isomerase/thioredoxin
VGIFYLGVCRLAILLSVLLAVTVITPILYAQTEVSSYSQKAQKAFQEGTQFAKQGNSAAAIGSFKKANKLAGDGCIPCLKTLNDLYLKTGDNKKAVEAAARLEQVVTNPQDKATAAAMQGAALYREAAQHKKKALFEQADAQFQHALQLQPDAADPLFLDGMALGNIGNDAGAHAAFVKYMANKHADPMMQARARRYIENPGLVREQMAPAFSVHTLQGDMISLDSLKGKVVLLDFWATWCGPCNQELPHVQKIAQRFQGKPLVVLSISFDKDAHKWKAFVQQHNMAWPQYRDGDGNMSTLFGVRLIPHYYVIDSDGVLRQWDLDTDIDGRLNKLVARAQELDDGAPDKTVATQSR